MKKAIVQEMDACGVDIFRINLSHTLLEDFERIVKDIQTWTKKPICVDTDGGQIRIGKIENGAVVLKTNEIISLTSAEILGGDSSIPLYPINPCQVLQIGDVLSLDFHSAIVQVIQIDKEKVRARVLFGGKVGSNKGAALDRQILLPAFTKKDLKILDLAKKMGLSHFALSFAANKQDVEKLRKFFSFYPVFIISKIESKLGLKNLEEICQASDAILIDRGDLCRDVPIQKIGLAQKHILDVAKTMKTPVYVATNLLESMVDNYQPTRAEINDITSTLLSGAAGLVLAAETAIGRYPIESVRMVSAVIKETQDYNVSKKEDGDGKSYFDSLYDYNLIEPHGGALVQNFMDSDKIPGLKDLVKIDVDEKTLLDIIQIAEGIYSPIRGFMNKAELESVLDHYRLPSGLVWPLPILLQTKKANKSLIGKKITIGCQESPDIYALMQVSDIEEIDLDDIASRWFGTTDEKHPGVFNFKQRGPYVVSGEVWLLQRPVLEGQSHILYPRQTRLIFKNLGWQKIVGFHTRNVVHRGHEFIQRQALDKVQADALFISPVIGPKKATDFSAKAILAAYEIMLKNDYYRPYPALIAGFNTYSRYSGPREAVFTALCRKNFGCSHFVVGRDHTGVGNYYPREASQKLFEKLEEGLGIIPIMFETAYFCKACNKVTVGCSHAQDQRLGLSGTQLRKLLLNGQEVPQYLVRKAVFQGLKEFQDSGEKLFEL